MLTGRTPDQMRARASAELDWRSRRAKSALGALPQPGVHAPAHSLAQVAHRGCVAGATRTMLTERTPHRTRAGVSAEAD